jgi:hypothetical protein
MQLACIFLPIEFKKNEIKKYHIKSLHQILLKKESDQRIVQTNTPDVLDV